ncbi:MAG: response regulator, partial [Desulfobacterales bacterium]
MRLLLVEDDTKIASFIIAGFKAAGFAVDHAADGQTGLALAATEPYDALILDLMLPRMDGLTLIQHLRRERIGIPVIILSAKGAIDDRVRGLQSGGDDYLTKPFAFSELLARVQALIRRAGGLSEPTRLAAADLSLD